MDWYVSMSKKKLFYNVANNQKVIKLISSNIKTFTNKKNTFSSSQPILIPELDFGTYTGPVKHIIQVEQIELDELQIIKTRLVENDQL